MSLHAVLSCHRRNKHGIEMFDYGGKGINNIWYNKIFSQKFHLRAQKKSRKVAARLSLMLEPIKFRWYCDIKNTFSWVQSYKYILRYPNFKAIKCNF